MFDDDVSMRQLHYNQRTMLQTVLQSLIIARSQLYNGNATLSDICAVLRSIFSIRSLKLFTSRFTNISTFLRQLYWLKAQEQIDYKS